MMRVLAAATVALSVVVGALPASAKAPNPCAVLLPEDLETIFEQPWRKGIDELGGACEFRRPTGLRVPDIVLSLIVERKASLRKAKEAFARGEDATRDIGEQVELVRGMGDEAYLTTIIGAEVLTFRVGRDLVELRVDRVDEPEETYRDQLLAVGDIVEARLLPPPRKHAPRPRNDGQNGG